MRVISRLNYYIGFFILLAGMIGGIVKQSFGASAVASSKDGIRYAVCNQKNSIKDASACAMGKCGADCEVKKTCEETGYGAIYQNFLNKLEGGRGVSKAVVGYACGQDYPGEALGQAMSVCKFYNRKANLALQLNRCYEKTRWFDPAKEEAKGEKWCEFATKISGIKSFDECLKSSRYPRPEIDCAHHVKQWCRKLK